MARSKKTVAQETVLAPEVELQVETNLVQEPEVEPETVPEVETNLVQEPEVEPETVPEVETNLVQEPEVESETVPEVETSLPSLIDQLTSLNSPAPETKKAKSQKNENVWGNVKMLFDQGLGNKEVLAQIHEMYGNTNTSYACIAWYRNKYNKLDKSGKMTVEQLLNQVATQFGQDQDWVKSQLSKI